jgi:hypothetical protein
MLCAKARFSPEAAFEMHKQLYKSKLNSLLGKRKITDEEVRCLLRLPFCHACLPSARPAAVRTGPAASSSSPAALATALGSAAGSARRLPCASPPRRTRLPLTGGGPQAHPPHPVHQRGDRQRGHEGVCGCGNARPAAAIAQHSARLAWGAARGLAHAASSILVPDHDNCPLPAKPLATTHPPPPLRRRAAVGPAQRYLHDGRQAGGRVRGARQCPAQLRGCPAARLPSCAAAQLPSRLRSPSGRLSRRAQPCWRRGAVRSHAPPPPTHTPPAHHDPHLQGEKVAALIKDVRMDSAVAIEVFADSTRCAPGWGYWAHRRWALLFRGRPRPQEQAHPHPLALRNPAAPAGPGTAAGPSCARTCSRRRRSATARSLPR